MLQQRAPALMRLHLSRSAMRFVGLLVADVTTLLLLRALIRAVRDRDVLGSMLGGAVVQLVPPGSYPMWQHLAAVFLGLAVAGTYRGGDRRRKIGRIAAGVTLGFGLLFWSRIWGEPSLTLFLGFLLTVVAAASAVVVERLLVDAGISRARPTGAARTLIVGPPGAARAAMQLPAIRDSADFDLVGFLNTNLQREPDALASFDRIIEAIHERHIDTVILTGFMPDDVFAAVVDSASEAGCHVYSLPRLFDGAYIRPELVWRRGTPLVQLTRPSLHGQQLVLKRAVDIVGSAIALLVTAPLLALIALAIRLDSQGPILFSQRRVGQGGRPFRILKFRTMTTDADEKKATLAHLNHTNDARLFKIPNDPRVTRVGRLLRNWSFDELPQLFNVLRGDMSLVGPRPFFEADLESYEVHHFKRLGAKPGITGLWQVSGRSSVVDFEEVVRLDREYISSWSIGLDLKILLLTFPAVLRRTGAY